MKIIEKSNILEFEKIQWLLKARSKEKDATRLVFTKVFIDTVDEQKVLVCTDSRRLHLLKDVKEFYSDCEDGLYDVIKADSKEIILNKSECKECFPNYKQIIPKEEDLITIGYTRADEKNNSMPITNAMHSLYTGFYKKYPERDIKIKVDLLKDALIDDGDIKILNTEEAKPAGEIEAVDTRTGDTEKVTITNTWKTSYMHPVVITNKVQTALVMPIQVRQE